MSFKKLMKRPRVLLCGAVLSMALAAHAGITLETEPGTKVADVIQSIQAQSGYRFFYQDDIASKGLNVVNLQDDSLDDALKKLFEGTSISYVIKDKVIYLRLEDDAPQSAVVIGEKHTISGTIVDETGEPLIGASVRIKGTNIAVATDFDGN